MQWIKKYIFCNAFETWFFEFEEGCGKIKVLFLNST